MLPHGISKLRPKTALAGFCIGIAVALASCGQATSKGSTTAQSSPLVVNTSYPPATIDPAEGLNQGDFLINSSTYVTLDQYAPKPGPSGTTQVDYTKFVPYLAQSWSIGPSCKTYTFKLSHAFRFSDGSPINAAAVKFSFERAVSMNGGGAYYIVDGHYKPPLFSSIATPAPYTVTFNLNVADCGLLSNWAQPAASIVEPKIVNEHGGVQANTVNTWMAGHIAGGGGPYILSSYKPGVSAVLTANPAFPLQVKSKKILVNIVTSPATLGFDAKTGEADITIGMPPSTAHSLKGVKGLTVATYPAPESEYFGFNTQVAPSNNLDLRKALRYATPVSLILQKANFGYGKLFQGPIIPDMPGFNASLEKPYPYDLAKAKALMAQSGLTLPVHFTVDIEAGDEAGSVIGPILQDYWSKVGVDITLQTLSAPVYVTTTETHKDQAYIRTAGPGVPTVPYYLGYSAICGISFNLTQLCIPKLDQLLNEGSVKPVSQQQPYWDQITTLFNQAAPRITFFEEYFPIVLSSRVKYYEFSDESTGSSNWGL